MVTQPSKRATDVYAHSVGPSGLHSLILWTRGDALRACPWLPYCRASGAPDDRASCAPDERVRNDHPGAPGDRVRNDNPGAPDDQTPALCYHCDL
jgi:hypothetical protein